LRRILPRLDLLAVVTGRESAVARRLVGVEGISYVGSYALAVSETPGTVADDIRQAREVVLPFLPKLPCVRMELKDVSFALHYRNCDNPEAMRRRLLSILEPVAAHSRAKLLEGKQVIEVVPSELPDKGRAFMRLLAQHEVQGAIFVGDDRADAEIFREIVRRREEGLPGLALAAVDDETPDLVRETADMHLAGVDAVEEFLVELAVKLAASRQPLS
jgi:trehalose 6-phosphate phosphatase